MQNEVMGPKEFLTDFLNQLARNKDKFAGISFKLQYDFSGDNNGKWYVEIIEGNIHDVVEGTIENPTCTFVAKYKNFYDAFTGKANPTAAFMTGKIKLKGDMGVAMKLQQWAK